MGMKMKVNERKDENKWGCGHGPTKTKSQVNKKQHHKEEGIYDI